MKRILVSILVASLVTFVWYNLSLGFLHWQTMDYRQFTSGDKVAQVILEEMNGSGVYALPNFPTAEQMSNLDFKANQKWNQDANNGPFAFIAVRREGRLFDLTISQILIFINIVIGSGVAVVLLRFTRLVGYWQKVFFIASCSLFGGTFLNLHEWIWWNIPITGIVVSILNLFVTWFIAGMIIVRLNTQKKTMEIR